MANIIETAKGAGSSPPCSQPWKWPVSPVPSRVLDRSRCLLRWTTPFAALPPGTVQTLVQNPPQLARILKFHVISGAYSRSDLVDQPSWRAWRGP